MLITQIINQHTDVWPIKFQLKEDSLLSHAVKCFIDLMLIRMLQTPLTTTHWDAYPDNRGQMFG